MDPSKIQKLALLRNNIRLNPMQQVFSAIAAAPDAPWTVSSPPKGRASRELHRSHFAGVAVTLDLKDPYYMDTDFELSSPHLDSWIASFGLFCCTPLPALTPPHYPRNCDRSLRPRPRQTTSRPSFVTSPQHRGPPRTSATMRVAEARWRGRSSAAIRAGV